MKKIRQDTQNGFTLIEILIVISGITDSSPLMIGVTVNMTNCHHTTQSIEDIIKS